VVIKGYNIRLLVAKLGSWLSKKNYPQPNYCFFIFNNFRIFNNFPLLDLEPSNIHLNNFLQDYHSLVNQQFYISLFNLCLLDPYGEER
jgi:hypothetical protein